MKISYSQVEEYCNELHGTAQNMKNVLDDISNISEKVSKSNWNGTASDYYLSKLKKVTSSFNVIFQEIENSILFMANCSDGYQALDKTIVKEICDNLNITEPNLSTSNIFNR